MSELLCVFDCGTMGARTIIFDINGKEIARAYEEYPIMKQPVGISEQDPIIWWNAVKKTCNEALKNVNIDDIIGISASFARLTTTIINKNGEVLHPALTYLDEREVVDTSTYHEDLRRSIPKILWLKNNKPELYAKASKIIFPDSYIYMKLCGKDVCITDPTNGIYGIMSMETLNWDEKLADSYDLPVDLWPELHTPGEILGDLSSEAAGNLGLKSNIPVVLGGGDQQCAALGMGVIEKGQAKVTTGSGTFVNYVTGDTPAKPPEGNVPIFSIPHIIKGKWLIEAAMPGTGTALKWFKDNFSQLQIKKCEEKNLDVYAELSKEAETISPGSEGLLFLPLYMFRKGTIHGIGWNHSRAHMIRAIMESSALSAQMYLNMLEAIGGAKVSELKSDGGAMNSDLWAQIYADVMARKIIIPENKDGAAVGAAILGFYGCGKYNSINNAIENMVRFEKEFNPIKDNTKVYKKLNRLFMPTLLDVFEKKRVTKDL